MKLKLVITFISFLIILSSCKGQSYSRSIHSEKPDQVHIIGDTTQALDNSIMVIYQDKKNNYWFGSWKNGLYKYDGKTILHFTTKHGLPDNRVEEIKEDKLGNIFINTSKGLCKYDDHQIRSIEETFPTNATWMLQPDDLWFKSPKQGYVCRYDGQNLVNLKIPTVKIGEDYIAKNPSVMDPYAIYCMYRDSKGNMWFGTAVLGAFRYNGISFDWITETDLTEMHNGPSNGVRSITEDKNGDFWFNTEHKYRIYNREVASNEDADSGVFYYREKSIGCLDGKKNGDLNEYLSIIKDDVDNLWMALYIHGVWRFDGEKIKHYPIQVDGKNISVYCLYKDNKGGIWLGTNENGVWRLNSETFSRFIP